MPKDEKTNTTATGVGFLTAVTAAAIIARYLRPARPLALPSASSSSSVELDGPGSDADWEDFRRNGKMIIDFVADYFQKKLKTYPVKSQVKPGYLAKTPLGTNSKLVLSDTGDDVANVLKDVEKYIVPGVTHWQHPNFFAYFPANTSPSSLCGDILSGMFNCIAFSWIASPAATEMETIVMDELARFVGLPEGFQSSTNGGGVIQGTASEATLVALLSARQKVRERAPSDASDDTVAAMMSKLVIYSSAQAHSSVKKAAMIAGMSMSQYRSIKADRSTKFAMDPEDLERQILQDLEQDLIPAICVATVGTTGVAAVDPLSTVGKVRLAVSARRATVCTFSDSLLWLHDV